MTLCSKENRNLLFKKKRRESWQQTIGYSIRGILILLFSVLLFQDSLSWSHDLLPEKNSIILKALQKAFGTISPERLQQLPGGFSSPGIYKFMIHKNPYVLRLSHPNRSLADEERTVFCMSLSAKRGLAPTIRYVSIQDRIVIMDFIQSKPLAKEEFSPKLLMDLALTVRKLHKGPAFPEFLSIFSVRKKFEGHLKSYKSNLIELASCELAKIEELLEKEKIRCPTHNDLKPENILFDGKKFWFIDWEASCHGNPYFDLATVIIFYEFDKEQENLFLKTYFGELPTDHQKARVHVMKQVVLGYYGTAYLMVSKIRKIPPLSPQEIEKLPILKDYFKDRGLKKNSETPYQELQKLGWILLKEVLINTKSVEFKNSFLKLGYFA